jgi:hypothetical protein
MIKKLIRFAGLTAFILFAGNSYAQQELQGPFSADTSKFISDLTEFFKNVGDNDAKEARDVLSTFTYHWTSNLLTPIQKKQVHTVCTAMAEQKLKVAPHYIDYLKSISLMVRRNVPPKAFDTHYFSTNYCLEGKNSAQKLAAYLAQTNLLLSDRAFWLTKTEAWYARDAVFEFAFDTVPAFRFNSVTLSCVVRGDSSNINKTSGLYFPITQQWYGAGGKVYWDRVNFDHDSVSVSLSTYRINFKTTSYSADTVAFVHKGYFKSALAGRFEERVITDVNPERATYPRFSAFSGDLVIQNLFKNIDYEGGFAIEGARILGSGTNHAAALIHVKRNNLPFIELKSSEFVIRPDRFVAARANTTIFIGNDSIYHPGLQVRYNKPNNEFAFTRLEEGLQQSPFFNSYHLVDMFPEAIYWSMDDDKLSLEAIRGPRSKGDALFESADFFSRFRYDKMQGMDDVNPANLVSTYVRKHSTDRFYVDEYAEYIKMPVEQVKVQLIKLANAGFIIYDIDNGFVKVKPRLNEFLAARGGFKDYDIIQFYSTVEKGSNAILDLKNLDLTLYGVREVMLSDSQYVYVVPRDGRIVMKKNRDFIFTGRVHAGFFEFYSNECSFDYSKFRMNMPKIDSMAMYVYAWYPDLNGYRPLIRVKNVVSDMSGELQIDDPANKSGSKSSKNYPIFESKDISYVYFDKKSTVSGVYKRDKFFYSVDPYVMDSLNHLPTENLKFEGHLNTGDIFPIINEPLRVQKDYSLGFIKKLPDEGLPIYAGSGVYSDTLKLSNNGLRGSGKLNYLASTSVSKDFLFTPDSTTATLKNFNLKETAAAADYPEVAINESKVKWIPGKEVMMVSNLPGDSINLFHDKVKLSGTLALTPTELKGSGNMTFEDALVSSNSYNFETNAFTSEISDFTLFTPDHKDKALSVKVYRSEVDFNTRLGHFSASGKGSKMEFPVNQYISLVDAFDWMMDKKILQLQAKTTFTEEAYQRMNKEQLLKISEKENRFISSDPQQDSLGFFAMRANYDLTSNILKVLDARIIRVADAAIFPVNGEVTIGKNGLMQELKGTTILANTDTRYHELYGADVMISSKTHYGGKGLYDYKPVDGEVQTLQMNTIGVDSQKHTYATASVSEADHFNLSSHFGFEGDIELNAPEDMLRFQGTFSLVHDCEALAHEWIKFNARLDPKNIMIPVSNDMENRGNGNLRTSILYSSTKQGLLPAFFVKPENINDQDIMSATGFLMFDTLRQAYKIGPEEKLADPSKRGNMLTFNTTQCVLEGNGKVNMVGDMGRLTMKSAGKGNYYMIPDSANFTITTSFDFLFSEEALKVFSTDLKLTDLKGIDVASTTYSYPLHEFLDSLSADKQIAELSTFGQFRKFPEELNHTLMLADMKLAWNPELRSFVGKGPVGIMSIGKEMVNKYVESYLEIGKRRTGDQFTFYFELEDKHWYYFSYANGIMQAISSNKDFNDKLVGLSEKDRTIKSGGGQRSYQYIVSNNEKKASFLRKMKQTFGE